MSVDKPTSKQHGEKAVSNQEDEQSQQRSAQPAAKQPDLSRRQHYLAELLSTFTLSVTAFYGFLLVGAIFLSIALTGNVSSLI